MLGPEAEQVNESARVDHIFKVQLVNIAISNNVGGVKHVLSDTCVCNHGRAPFCSLSWFARFQPGLALNRSGQELGPTQPSLRSLTAIKIRFFELPHLLGAGSPIITSVIDCT